MNTGNVIPYTTTLVASAARTGTSNSGAIDLPLMASWSIVVDSAAGTGTSPTLDVVIQCTPDDGTTWHNAPLRAAQITTAASVQEISFNAMGVGQSEAAWQNAVAATGGALAKNTVLSKKIRVLWTIGGTNPSFTFAVYGRGTPRSSY